MNLFDKQLRSREQADNDSFAETIESFYSAVMDVRLRNALSDSDVLASAIDEIIRYYRFRIKPEEYVVEYKSVEEQIEDRLRPYGIRNRAVKLEAGWSRNAIGALLGTLKEDGSAVALIPGKNGGYTLVDVKSGKRVPVTKKTEELIDKGAVCFYQPLPNRPLTLSDLLVFMLHQMRISDIVECVILMVISTLIGLLAPVFTKRLFGSVLESKDVTVLLSLLVFIICFTISRLLFATFQSLFNSKTSIERDVAVQAALMSRIISLPPSFFKQYSAGELSQRMAYTDSLCSRLFGTIGMTALSTLFSLVYIGQIAFISPSLAVPALLISLATVALTLETAFVQRKISREKMEIASKTSGLTYETITGIQKIKLAGAEKRMFSRWGKQYARQAQLEYNPPLFLKMSGTISVALSLTGSMILYAIAIKNNISTSDYCAFITSYAMVSSVLMTVASIAVEVADIKPALEMAEPIMKAEPEIRENKTVADDITGNIDISHLSFKYDGLYQNVIDDLSLTVKPGEYIAIVGATGCGKSTLIRLLLGFEKPDRGSISYDGRDISLINPESLRQRIGTVTQGGKLFRGDIYSNIVLTAPQAGIEKAWKAAEIAAIDEDIKNMPMGMQTYISEGQGGISGGQKQRLMIARAVVSDPKILIFDEATSAVDNITQKKISDAIDALKCTRIVVAHRLSTIQNADRIVFLDKGRIVEDGTYEELIAKDGLFAKLVERQRLDI